MSTFTDESRLLIEHWGSVTDILKARDRLAEELVAVLLTLESELSQMDWWHDKWYFAQHRGAQVYISNEEWKQGDRGAIWIGVEKVEPEYVFGSERPANLYVYVNNRNDRLLAEVVDRLQGAEMALPGEVDTRMSNYTAARRDVRPYIGGDVDGYITGLKEEILEFFRSYANFLWGIDEVIRQYM